MKLKTVTYTLPAHWASALINADWSGYDEIDRTEIIEWCSQENKHRGALSCSNETIVTRFNGLITECLEFTFAV